MAKQGVGPVLVGVDGSEGSRAALDWASDYAAAVSVPVEIVIAWHYPAGYGAVPMVGLEADFEETAAKVVSEMAGDAGVSHPAVKLSTKVVAGRASEVLVGESEHAGLLVVGSRGHGAFAGMLLGSVSTHCVHHAHCPVVVVR